MDLRTNRAQRGFKGLQSTAEESGIRRISQGKPALEAQLINVQMADELPGQMEEGRYVPGLWTPFA